VLLLALAACGQQQQPAAGPAARADSIIVTIPRGATFSQAIDSLIANGVIDNRDWFSLYARARGLSSSLKSGLYPFHRNESWSDVVTALKRGRGVEVRFTVREGLMASEVAEIALYRLHIPKAAFLAAVRDTALERELGAVDHPVDVDVDDPLCDRVGLANERPQGHDPGVVDEHVERPEAILRLIEKRREACAVGDVDVQPDGAAAELVDGLLS